MSYVLENLHEADGMLTCAHCGQTVGAADDGYHRQAGMFDLPLAVGQHPAFAANTSRYVLRHYGCRGCGTLFDVDMLAVGTDDDG